MQFLLDTCAILRYAQGSDELPTSIRNLMEREICYYSIASLWEVAIKQKLGMLDLNFSVVELAECCSDAGFIQLKMTPEQIERTKSLDFIHRDPFDRLIVSQALTENLTIITSDKIIPKYPVKTLW